MTLYGGLNTKETIARRMKVFQPYLKHIQEHGFHKDLIDPLISDHRSIRNDVILLQKRYEVSSDGVPILERPISLNLTENEKVRQLHRIVNNKVNTASDGEIVDTKVGYVFGIPINYTLDVNEHDNMPKLQEAVEKFRIRNNVADRDSSLGKVTDIAGYGARLIYTATEDDLLVLKVANIDPAECIFFFDESISEPKYAMRYYETFIVDENVNKKQVTIVEFYDDKSTYFYSNVNGDYELTNVALHGADYCPLFGIENNDEMQGAAVRVLNLIDAYDRSLSDANNEVESMRLAMLILRNVGLSEDEGQQLQKSGYLELWGEDAEVSYLTKNVNDSMIEHHLARLEKNIMRVSKNVDFTSEEFSSQSSGVAIKFRTMALEHKAIIAEQKMRSALQYQFKVMCSAWSKLGICNKEDYLKVFFEFKRNLPDNL